MRSTSGSGRRLSRARAKRMRRAHSSSRLRMRCGYRSTRFGSAACCHVITCSQVPYSTVSPLLSAPHVALITQCG